MAGSEIKSTIFASRQPTTRNIYLTTYKTKKKLNFLRKEHAFCKKRISDYLRH